MYLNARNHETADASTTHRGGVAEPDADVDEDGDDQAACTTPEIITSICNAYITLASSSAVVATATTPPPLSVDSELQALTPRSMSADLPLPSTAAIAADSNLGSCSYCGPMSQCQCHGNGSSSSVASDSPPPPPQQQLSVEAMRSHLIKESLKVTIQCKRLANGQQLVPFSPTTTTAPASSDMTMSTTAASFCSAYCFKDELTPEDQERRRRRRERNKVAATKCRNKKKERTVTLLMESDLLEHTNSTLRTEIHKLEGEKQRLLEMLNYHIPACPLQSTVVGSGLQQQLQHQQRPGHLVTVGSQQQQQRPPYQSSQYAEGMRCSQAHEIHGRATIGFRDNSMPHRIT